ncbi:hypothetical protein MPTA5024_02055 [Microbispora sp. ATCC PTA-5024]|nr:hypothetical protein MPTA5024_02055 [Microbispora sp. ATCC PTA-5024]
MLAEVGEGGMTVLVQVADVLESGTVTRFVQAGTAGPS